MMSDGNTSLGHAPNQLLTAAAGTISYKCTDAHNVAIHLGDFFYTHLLDNATLVVGASFAQGAVLGPLKTGSFTGPCGYASQPSGWFHVHWGFPSGNLQVENWTLSMSTGDWTNGGVIASPGTGWILAGPTAPCLAPALSSPTDGNISTSQTINFSWSDVGGCIFSGYSVRIKTVPTMDLGGGTVLDTTSSQTALSALVPSDFNNLTLYWGVKAANAPFGSAWAVRQFSIQPGAGVVPTDYGFCADDGQQCPFTGPALIYYGIRTHALGPLSLTDGVDCNSTVLGDPGTGTGNHCFIKGGQPDGSTWCAADNGTCKFKGYQATVYYGGNGTYNTLAGAVSSIDCNSSIFGDPFPGLAKSCYYIRTGGAPVTVGFTSNGLQDGFIIEAGQATGLGGTIKSTATVFKLGDDAANQQIRSILSFKTASLPDNAVVTSAKLKIRNVALKGSDPFATLGNILVDIRQGPFGTKPALQKSDFQAVSSQDGALTIENTPEKSWYSGWLSPAYLGYINRTGATQFRLRFAQATNSNLVGDFMTFYAGDYTVRTNYQPTLIITYYVPYP